MKREDIKFLDDTIENREHTAGEVMEFLERTGIMEMFASTENKEKFIENLTPEKAEEFLERLNGIIIGAPINQREIYTYRSTIGNKHEKYPVYVSPDAQTQKQIMRRIIIPSLKRIAPENLDAAAGFAAVSINLLHAFPDGNGRLARLVYLLLHPDEKITSTEEGKKIIEDYLGPRQGVYNFDPSLIQDQINSIVVTSIIEGVSQENEVVEIEIKEDGVLSDQSDFKQRGELVNIYKRDKGDFVYGIIKFYLSENKELTKTQDGKVSIDVKEVFDNLHSPDQMNRLYMCYQLVKALRFKAFAKLFENPQQFESPVPDFNLKEYFEGKIINRATGHGQLGEDDMNVSG